jgi:pyridoxamine 5'-phosphate oxidase
VTSTPSEIPGPFEGDPPAEPMAEARRWVEEAERAGVAQPDAMTLATASADGDPSARMVLLKGIDDVGFVFYTNHGSRKGRDLAENPRAALILYWNDLRRQLRAAGTVERVSDEESDAYFATRPYGSRIAATVSRQSSPITSRAALEQEYERLDRVHEGGHVPRPAYWGGYRVVPATVEFWRGRDNRLHDRLRYTRQRDGSWSIERLAP